MAKGGDRRSPRNQIRIVDSETLRSVLEELRKEHGSCRKAAAWLGLVPTTFSRLWNGRIRRSMSSQTYHTIRRKLEEVDPGEFAVEGEPDPPVPTLLQRFEDSIRDFEAQLMVRRYRWWLKAEMERLRPRCAPLLNDLKDQPRFKGHLRDFARRIGWSPDQRVEEDEDRVTLAIYRVVEPLVDAEQTAQVERGWEELESDRDFGQYLKAAFRREEILLQRDTLDRRVRSLDSDIIEAEKASLAGL